jgi:phosphatidyl-myo-inositol dimannoside synthase
MSDPTRQGGERRAIRTLVLTPDFPPAHGGIQVVAHRLVAHAPGLACRVVALDHPEAARFDRASGISVRRTPRRGMSRQLAIGGLNAAALAQALAFRPAAVLSAHITTAPAAAAIRRLFRVPVVQYFHAREIAARPRLAGFAARYADALVAVSSYTRELVLAVGGRETRIHVINPGVDLPAAPAAERDGERPTVVTIARIESGYKGHDVMVKAMAAVRRRLPEARWVVIGDGSLRPRIVALARSAGLDDDAAVFLGSVSDRERDEWLRRAHVFAMPSRLPEDGLGGEGFGIAYMEANAHGLPVVAGAVAGALDAVDHGTTGLLVDPDDEEAVAGALLELLEDPDRRTALGAEGARRAREFAWPNVAARVEALISGLAR